MLRKASPLKFVSTFVVPGLILCSQPNSSFGKWLMTQNISVGPPVTFSQDVNSQA